MQNIFELFRMDLTYVTDSVNKSDGNVFRSSTLTTMSEQNAKDATLSHISILQKV